MRALCLTIALLVAAPLLAAENYPRPEFSHGQTFPEVLQPAARPESLAVLDVALLALCLGLAVYFGFRSRSRTSLFLLALFALGYFGFIRHGCVCSVGAIQNVAYALGGNGYALPVTVALFFALPVGLALFFGRSFCAGVCPLGAAQEVVLLRPLRVPAWLDEPLSLLPFVYGGFAVLYAAIGSTFLVCRLDPLVPFFRFSSHVPLLVAGGILLLLGVFVGRPYCRYLCPLGALFRILAPLSRFRPQITREECVNCHLCASACPYGAIRPPTGEQKPLDRRAGRRQLGLLLLLLPVFIAAGGGLLRLNSTLLSQLDPRVRLAGEVWRQERQPVTELSPTLEAFGNRGVPNLTAYREAAAVQQWFDTGAWFLGGWLGLIFGLKLIGTSLRRRRPTYEIDVGACVVCGRCYNACPLERAQRASLTI